MMHRYGYENIVHARREYKVIACIGMTRLGYAKIYFIAWGIIFHIKACLSIYKANATANMTRFWSLSITLFLI